MKTVPKRDMRRAVRHLRRADPVMADVIDRVGPIDMVLRRGRFRTLVRSIVSQQISTSAARSINERVRRAVRPREVALPLVEVREGRVVADDRGDRGLRGGEGVQGVHGVRHRCERVLPPLRAVASDGLQGVGARAPGSTLK